MNTKHVTSLEISKKLQELGVKQESLFFWNWQEQLVCSIDKQYQHTVEIDQTSIDSDNDTEFSAYLTDELLEILPSAIEDEDETFRLTIEKTGENPYPYKVAYRMNIETLGISYKNELSNALGKMLITLIEQGLYKS